MNRLEFILDKELSKPSVSSGKPVPQKKQPKRKVKSGEIRLFASTLASLLGGGVPLLKALSVLGKQANNPALKKALEDIRERIQHGEGLSSALETRPDLFPFYFSRIVWAGEISGSLEKVLGDLAAHLKKEEELKAKFIEVVTYPCIVAVFSVLTVGALFHFVIPRLAVVYRDFDADLPRITEWLLTASRFSVPFFAVLALLCLSIAGFAAGKRETLVFLLNQFPFTGPLIRGRYLCRFSSMLSLLMESGMPVLEALKAVSRATREKFFRRDVENIMEALSRGEGFSSPLSRCAWMPASCLALIEAGEESGNLPDAFRQTGEESQQRLESNLFLLLKFVEPLMIAAVGIFTGGIAAAVILPMMRMNMLVR